MPRDLGWKTIAGALVKALGAFITNVIGDYNLGNTIEQLGEALIAIGLGHKLVKLQRK